MIRKTRLVTPGPAPVHPAAIAAAVEPLPHHRTAEFKRRFLAIQAGLQAAFRTAGPVAVIASSGTGAMEACLVNLFAPGDRLLVLSAGKFSGRWAEIAEAFGIRAHVVSIAAGEPFGAEDVAEAVAARTPIAGLLMTASETSTGAAFDVPGAAAAARRVIPDVAVVVDAITGIGAMPIHTDEWELDAVCGGSQKAFMVPPGLGFVACSPRGWERVAESRGKPRYYMDLRKYRDGASEGQTPFTPATGLLLQLEAALAALAEAGGIGALERNAQRLAGATLAAAEALGLELLSPTTPSPAVTAIRAPRSGVAPEIVERMRDKHGIQIAGGQGDLKPDIFRIGHIGYLDEFDLLGTIAALERVLVSMGFPSQAGGGVAAASAALDSSASFTAD